MLFNFINTGGQSEHYASLAAFQFY